MKLLPDFTTALNVGIFADYIIDSLKKEAAAVFEKAGKIGKVRELVPENQLRGHFILEGEKANVWVSFTLTPENPGLIQEYHIRLIDK